MNFVAGEVILLDKPYGWTSFDAVKYVRGALVRRTGIKRFKVGHAGTLDPLATGVMVVCTGKATKMIDKYQAGVKTYLATMALGATTPSSDLETEIDATYPTEHITRPLVEEALKRFVGRIEQIPPSYSACKVDGRRAYLMARKGQAPDLKPKVLVIDDIKLLEYSRQSIYLEITCSKGTYIRALARDVGEALGTGAHLSALRRVRVGGFDISQCMTPQEAAKMIAEVDVQYPEGYEINN